MSGVRETQRRAWREAVARAAEEMQRGRHKHRTVSSVLYADYIRHREALSAPKPWTRPAKADLGKWGYGLGHLGSMLSGHWGPLLAEVAREVVNARLRPLRRKRRAAQRRRR